MNPRRHQRAAEDRIVLGPDLRSKAVLQPARRRTDLWTLAGGVAGSTILFWVMVQLGQASSDPKGTAPPSAVSGVPSAAGPDDGAPLATPSPAVQGPALDVPREVIDMLDLRKRDLDRREEVLRQNEERLLMVKAEIEQLLTTNEAIEKRIQAARTKPTPPVTTGEKAQPAKPVIDRERQAREQQAREQKNQHQAQLAKIYETMPAEEAAARLERMPDRKVVEILRLVKGKTAGAILAQVKVERAAKLTEQLLAQTP